MKFGLEKVIFTFREVFDERNRYRAQKIKT